MKVSLSLLLIALTIAVQSSAHTESSASAARISDMHAAETLDSRLSEEFDRLYLGEEAVERACKYRSSISNPPPFKRVILTFDDGPNGEETPWLLDVLKKYNVPATFFFTGSHASAHPDVVRRVAREGHLLVANHSWNHPNFHTLSATQQFKQIQRSMDVLSQFQTQKFFRYPFGNSTCESNTYLRDVGYQVVGWHVDSCDWAFSRTGTVGSKEANICGVKPENRSNFVQHVVDSVKRRKGGILLMHEVHPNTIHQMEEILDELIKDGYTFGRLNEPGFAPSMR